MATITKRKVHGHIYYYLVASKRIDGQPRLVLQKYLGRAEEVVAKLEGKAPVPQRVVVREYGASRALMAMARRLRLVEHIDAGAPTRDAGLSVGTYILLAVLHRILAPCSKAKLAEWYHSTALYHDLPVRDADLTSQRFWDPMGYLTPERICAIETALTEHMVKEFALEWSTVVYDATNLYPWIDTHTPSELAPRGHQKQHRTDLKAIGLALLVTTDFNIPLLHAVYPGSGEDSQEFQSITEDLVARYERLRNGCERATLVCDKENHAETNEATVDASPFHFVGSLQAHQLPELFDAPAKDFVPVPEHSGLTAYRTTRKVFGTERTIVVTYNEALYLGQCQGELVRLRKLQQRLQAIHQELEKAERRPSVATLRQRVARAVAQAGPPIRQCVTTQIVADDKAPTFTYTIDHEALYRWGEQHWGKTILVTDRDDWSTAEIIAAYRDASHVESTFRDLKQPCWIGWQPQFHWTDDKIRVHGLICVLAVTLSHLLHREYARAGLEISLPRLLEQLATIQEVAWVYPSSDHQEPQISLTDRTPQQQQLLDLLAIPMPMAQ
ncbi:MAG: IS1634 family transposase [Firmicutes bacterium]|nr:IS1634 family transposase [Bacillota bacterium]